MNDSQKKQVPLRLSPTLFAELTQWAEDDFRSLNSQIEYLLTEAVKKRISRGIKSAEKQARRKNTKTDGLPQGNTFPLS